MTNLIARVEFEKRAEKDNWGKGCYGGAWTVYTDKFSVEFTDTDDLKQKLAKWVSSHFDVNEDDFAKYADNECENNRFDYCQGEDADGNHMVVTEDNPEGYLADYTFWIEVTQKVDYIL